MFSSGYLGEVYSKLSACIAVIGEHCECCGKKVSNMIRIGNTKSGKRLQSIKCGSGKGYGVSHLLVFWELGNGREGVL